MDEKGVDDFKCMNNNNNYRQLLCHKEQPRKKRVQQLISDIADGELLSTRRSPGIQFRWDQNCQYFCTFWFNSLWGHSDEMPIGEWHPNSKTSWLENRPSNCQNNCRQCQQDSTQPSGSRFSIQITQPSSFINQEVPVYVMNTFLSKVLLWQWCHLSLMIKHCFLSAWVFQARLVYFLQYGTSHLTIFVHFNGSQYEQTGKQCCLQKTISVAS